MEFEPIRTDARVVENRDEGGPNRRLRLGVDGWPGFAPGQFVMLSPGARSAAARSDPLLPRPMAVYRAGSLDGAAEVEILYKRSGRGTVLLSEATAGQLVRLVGPLGRGFSTAPEPEWPILVAGGTGIASVYELAAQLGRGGSRAVQVLFGGRSAGDLMGRADFESLPGVQVRVATEDGSDGVRGLVTELLEAELEAGPTRQIFTCGPTPMMRRVAELAQAGGHACEVSLENNMACGFGVCLGCAAPRAAGAYALVCREGPVFDGASVGWEGLP